MGMAKLNVWFRDEKCRPYYNRHDVPNWDWVTVTNCMGETVINKHPVPVGQANVELELPPGCYVVQGHVCGEEVGVNEETDRAIAIVGCGQEECVNLIVPRIRTCVVQIINPLVQMLDRLNVPEVEIDRTSQLLMRAGGVTREEMVAVLQAKHEVVRTFEGAAKVAARIQRTIKVVGG